jgi:hypothetical protein
MPRLTSAHHEIRKRDSPNEIKIKVKLSKYLGFEFKPRQVNNSSQSNQITNHLVSHMLYMIGTCVYVYYVYNIYVFCFYVFIFICYEVKWLKFNNIRFIIFLMNSDFIQV